MKGDGAGMDKFIMEGVDGSFFKLAGFRQESGF